MQAGPVTRPGCARHNAAATPGAAMSDHVYKSIELTGSSNTSIEEAVNTAVARAGQTVRNMQWFEVVETRGHIRDGKVAYWQVTIKVGFTLE
jgi:dodecin